MKKRKRGALVLLAVLVALSTTAVAFAEPALGVWIDYSTFSNADGSLLVRFADGVRPVNSGEVSVRGVLGYV